MEKFFLVLITLILLSHCFSELNVGDVYQLPEPKKEGGMPLNEALSKRKKDKSQSRRKSISSDLRKRNLSFILLIIKNSL